MSGLADHDASLANNQRIGAYIEYHRTHGNALDQRHFDWKRERERLEVLVAKIREAEALEKRP